MRHAFLSDIHGNLEALEAVAGALREERIDDWYCLGDIVGYGADPKACIETVRSLGPRSAIAGNHEWAVLGRMNLDYFNETAAAAVRWTARQLDQREADYCASFGLVHETETFTLVHGTLAAPEQFRYLVDADDARTTMDLMERGVCFVGHTHVAGVFYEQRGRVQYTPGPTVTVAGDAKYVVNVGSVGQPRDLDPRAAYVLYDDTEGTITIRRVAYDLRTAAGKIRAAALPERFAARLAEGR